MTRVLDAGAIPLAVGGDHSISLPCLRAVSKKHGPLALIQFDAHIDTWGDYFGGKYFHGSPFRRAIEEQVIAPSHYVQIGIRGPMYGEDEDFAFQRDRGVTTIDIGMVKRDGADATMERVREIAAGRPVYVTFDIDSVDPAFAPGTGTPEVGGLTSYEAQELVRAPRRPEPRRLRHRRSGARLRRPRPDHRAARREYHVRDVVRDRQTSWRKLMRSFVLAVILTLTLPLAAQQGGPAPVVYKVSFPAPEHRYAVVDVTFANVPAGALQARMSRSSPGRYAVHEFAKNVYDVQAFDGKGKELKPTRPNPYQWDVAGHDGTVRITYKIYGDLVDGTYLGIDTSHAHMNMPATLMWARRLDDATRTRHVRAAARLELEAGDAALSDLRRVDVHRAEPAVPVRQPDGAERVPPPPVHGEEPRRQDLHDPRGGAHRQLGPGHRSVRRRRREDRERTGGGVRRISGVRHRHLYVPRGLPAVERGRRHGASQQHRRQRSRQRNAAGSARHRTSSSTRGTSSASVRRVSSRSITKKPT